MKKIIALALAAMMSALTFTACSGGNDTAPPPAESAIEQPAVETTPTSTPSADLAPVSAQTVQTFGFDEALALAISRGYEERELMRPDYEFEQLDNLVASAELSLTEKRDLLKWAISEWDVTEEHHKLYDFYAEHAEDTEPLYNFYGFDEVLLRLSTDYAAGELSDADSAIYELYMNLEAKGEGMGILYRIVLGDAYYRAPDTYAVADNAGDNSSSTADEDMQTYEQGYSDGLEFEKSNPSDQRRQDFESFLNYFLREGICTEDYANGVHDGLAAGLNPSVTSATATTTPNTPTPSNGGDIATFTPKYSSATSSTPAPNSGGNTASGGTLDEKLQSANDNRNRAESNDAIAYKIWFDFVSMDIDTTGMIDKYSRREKPEYESYIVFGETVNGLPNGFCYLAKSDSTVSYGVDVKNIIAGTFVNGKLNGEGVMRVFNNENNVEIKGTFANGLPAGSISIKDDKNGSEYAGGYKNGHFNGVGYFKDKVGNIWSGEWENGKLNGYASLYDVVNKTEYLGYFVDGMPQGAGYVSNIFADNISAEAAIGEAWGYFDGFEMTEVYGYHELTLEEKTAFMKAAAENAAKVNDMINATLSEANAIISAGNAASAEIWSDSSASTDQFKANLKESQTFSQVNLIPNYSGIINPDGSFIIGY